MSKEMKRTKAQMEFEIRYSIRLLTRQARLYSRLNAALVFITLLGSSSAAGAFFSDSTSLAGAAGILLVATTIIQFVVKPSEKNIYALESKKRYAELLGKIRNLTEPEIDRDLWKLHGTDVEEVNALREIADFEARQEMGQKGKLELGFMERLLIFFA